jgi:hypothetical protein
MYIYDKPIKLQHNEIPGKINQETGEVKPIEKRKNNIPDGKSLLDYEKFHLKNDKLSKVALNLKILSYEELGVIDYMCTLSEFGTNSLKPINNETSLVDLESIFSIPRQRIKSVFQKLFRLGVYLEITYFSAKEEKELTYWVLNPYISWKGRLKDDSMFSHFSDCYITKLIQ